jgi:hypothetical protein
MDGFRFDHLTRLVGTRLSRRTGLALVAAAGLTAPSSSARSKSKKISVCYNGRTRKVKKKGWRNHYPGATKEPNCGSGCCTADACFAAAVDTADRHPIGFDCCPAALLCRSPKAPFPDQCCYPDETCRPSLVDDANFETICCRPCNGACCPKQNDECIGGVCVGIDTARLPRTRRG